VTREAGDSAGDYKTFIVMIRLSPAPRAFIIFQLGSLVFRFASPQALR